MEQHLVAGRGPVGDPGPLGAARHPGDQPAQPPRGVQLRRYRRDAEGRERGIVDPRQQLPDEIRDPDCLPHRRQALHRGGRRQCGCTADVMARLRPHLHVPAILQQLVGAEHGGQAHPFLSAVPANRGEAVARTERTPLDKACQLVGEPLVEDPVAPLAAPGQNCSGRCGHIVKLLRSGPAR